jgi:hypothetical protein
MCVTLLGLIILNTDPEGQIVHTHAVYALGRL